MFRHSAHLCLVGLTEQRPYLPLLQHVAPSRESCCREAALTSVRKGAWDHSREEDEEGESAHGEKRGLVEG
jgi:hypothetical protein